MDIYIGKLAITNFCKENIEHIKFKREMLDDGLMCYFFPHFDEHNFLTPSDIKEKTRIKNFYLLKDSENLIGWFYTGGKQRQISLNYSIHPNYRKQGYATILLEECRDYFFENDIANEIELVIKNNNSGSLKAAKKAKYKCIGKFDSFYIYNSKKN